MRQRLATGLRLVLVATLAATGLWFGGSYAWAWWNQGRFEEGTDNAYVRGEVTPIAPKVAAWLAARFGAGRSLIAATILLTTASAGSALITDIDALVAWRVLQGVP